MRGKNACFLYDNDYYLYYCNYPYLRLDSMYVCICNAVTDGHIRQAVKNGASTMRDIYARCGVAKSCGKCACLARDILREAVQATPHSGVDPARSVVSA